eukprot:TRINITY_DN280_c0_g2_i1.p1 TRINITY_DN280_c0_g2~~TRINITY_DN280_c0_g2_i1.p1  ORF type:complete len:252 (-),score=51.73 TRINITY_DN280_c0_g2_i1:198-953(-)
MQRLFFFLGRSLRETGQALDRAGCRMQGNFSFKEELNRHRRIMPLYDKKPFVGLGSFIAPNASVIGEVEVGKNSCIWYGAVLRGDVNNIKVGDETSIGDRTIVHVARHNLGGPKPTVIGNRVNVGQGAILHACTLEDGCEIGSGSIICDGAVIGKNAIVESGSLVTNGKQVPAGQVWGGNPAVRVRDLSETEITELNNKIDRVLAMGVKHQVEHEKTPLQREEEADKWLYDEGAKREADFDQEMEKRVKDL